MSGAVRSWQGNLLTRLGCHALNQKPKEVRALPVWLLRDSAKCGICMQIRGDSSAQKFAFAVLSNLRSLPVLDRPRRAFYCTQDISQGLWIFQLTQLSGIKTLATMDQQAPRTPFSPARSNLDVSHRSGGPASAAKCKKPKQQV